MPAPNAAKPNRLRLVELPAVCRVVPSSRLGCWQVRLDSRRLQVIIKNEVGVWHVGGPVEPVHCTDAGQPPEDEGDEDDDADGHGGVVEVGGVDGVHLEGCTEVGGMEGGKREGEGG